MGCDIHLFIEYKVGNEPWFADLNHQEHTEDGFTYLKEVSSTNRDYELFSVLAGVRGRGPNPKGLPADVSPLIKSQSDRFDSDGHSHSYSSLEEFERALKKADYNISENDDPIAFSDNYEHSYENLLAYCKAKVSKMKLDLEAEKALLGQKINTAVKCRLVYFFDN